MSLAPLSESNNLKQCSGPNWIHGADNNPIVDLANETHTAVFPPESERTCVYDESGQLLTDERASEISEIVWGIIGDAFKHSNEYSTSIPPDMSLMDYFRLRVEQMKLDRLTSKLVFQMAHIWGDYVGEPIETQSLKYCWLEECLDESRFFHFDPHMSNKLIRLENLFVVGTYKAILGHIAQAALDHSDLQLSTKVISIHSGFSSNGNPSITVKTATNKTLNFDEVVMTAPLGWLKRNPSTFVPSLPSRVKIAIRNMSYGRLEKVYITFPIPFWTRIPDSTVNLSSPPSRPPFFTQFLSPNYAPDQNPHRWTLEPLSLASLPAPAAHPTLLFYLNGSYSQHVTSLISSLEPTSPKYHSILSNFFHPYYSRLPNYNPASPDCQPAKILSTNWQNDELAGCGSYTNFQISSNNNAATEPRQHHHKNGDDINNIDESEAIAEDDSGAEIKLDQDIEALREGCPDRGIWFAGEHTAPFIALGTVTGAYWSGEAIGRRIAAAYGIGHEVGRGEMAMVGETNGKVVMPGEAEDVNKLSNGAV